MAGHGRARQGTAGHGRARQGMAGRAAGRAAGHEPLDQRNGQGRLPGVLPLRLARLRVAIEPAMERDLRRAHVHSPSVFRSSGSGSSSSSSSSTRTTNGGGGGGGAAAAAAAGRAAAAAAVAAVDGGINIWD